MNYNLELLKAGLGKRMFGCKKIYTHSQNVQDSN